MDIDLPINRVAASGLITLDLENYLPKVEVVNFDLSPFLFKNLILKEKDYRQALKELDWSKYEAKVVTVFCTSDAIIAKWAFMLAASYLQNVAQAVYFGSPEECKEQLFYDNLNKEDFSNFKDQRVIIKGCSENELPEGAYVSITTKLMPFVKSLMYGEACSSVPVYKRK